MDMPLVYQSFYLAEGSEESSVERFRENMGELVKRGYHVLESGSLSDIYGAPTSIIVGSEFGKPVKSDFSNAVRDAGFTYKSGDFYCQSEVRDSSLDCLEGVIGETDIPVIDVNDI